MDISKLLEIISERFIKPSSPTSSLLQTQKISYMDQVMPNIHPPMAFFYPNIQGSNCLPASKISGLLQLSLSKTLTYYYPFAGRLKSNLFIDCNDMGVQFLEARIKCRLSEIINKPNSHLEDLVFPNFLTNSVPVDPSCLVFLQVNYFDCGGLALSVLMSHKIADASSMCNFFNDWGALASQIMSSDDHHSVHIPSPQFIGASVFPPVEDPAFQQGYTMPNRENCVSRRFLFHASRVDQLKAMATDSGVDNPTRVEVVTALLCKCAIAASTAKSGSFRPSMLRNAANLRPITTPQLPQNSVGNFFYIYHILVNKEDDVRFPELVRELRNGRRKIRDELEKKLMKFEPRKDIRPTFASPECMLKDFDVYHCSSLCRFPLYDVDFGWGKPSLVRYATKLGQRNAFILMDLRNGEEINGIQAVVTLEKQEMCLFEADQELLTYASSNGENEWS